MKSKLNYLSERQSVLAQNVANADTPGYKAQDISAPDFKKMLHSSGSVQKLQNNGGGRLQMAVTDPKHLMGNGNTSAFQTIARDKTDELNPDGNNVSVEEEMAKVAENQADYQKVLNLYSKTITLFKTAIGNPGTSS